MSFRQNSSWLQTITESYQFLELCILRNVCGIFNAKKWLIHFLLLLFLKPIHSNENFKYHYCILKIIKAEYPHCDLGQETSSKTILFNANIFIHFQVIPNPFILTQIFNGGEWRISLNSSQKSIICGNNSHQFLICCALSNVNHVLVCYQELIGLKAIYSQDLIMKNYSKIIFLT